MTGLVKDELSRLPAGRTCCLRAELAAVLRFAGVCGGGWAGGDRAELDSGLVTSWLRRQIGDLYGYPASGCYRLAIWMPTRGAWRGYPRTRAVETVANARAVPA